MPPNEGSFACEKSHWRPRASCYRWVCSRQPRRLAVDQVDTEKLRKAVTVSGILQHERAFQRIANDNDGTRASGTPGFDASADYVVRKLRQAGYKVKRADLHLPVLPANVAPPELSEVSPTARDIETGTFTYSGSGEVTGQVIPTNDILIPPGPDAQHSTSGCERTTSRQRRQRSTRSR